jgi:hypothetical protein
MLVFSLALAIAEGFSESWMSDLTRKYVQAAVTRKHTR